MAIALTAAASVRDIPADTATAVPSGTFAEISFDASSTPTFADFALGDEAGGYSVAITVESPGFDDTGSAITVTRNVYVTALARRPYPNNSAANVVFSGGTATGLFALSEPIYAGDTITQMTLAAGWYSGAAAETITSGLTNAATLAYPKAICRWAKAGFEVVNTGYVLEAVAHHLFGVAAVKFSWETTGGTELDSQVVTARKISDLEALGNGTIIPKASVYAATPDPATTPGDIVIGRVIVYPKVGNAASINDSDDGVSGPQEQFGPYTCRYGYTPLYHVVDPVNGDDATAAANTDEAVAATTAYATIAAALTASDGGDVVALRANASAYTHEAITNYTDIAVTIRPYTGETATYAGATNDFLRVLIRLQGLNAHSSNTGAFKGTDADTGIIFDGCDINLTGFASCYNWGGIYFETSSVTRIRSLRSSAAGRTPICLNRGTHWQANSDHDLHIFCHIASTGDVTLTGPHAADLVDGITGLDNFVLWNCFYDRADASGLMAVSIAQSVGGAIVGNVLRQPVATGGDALVSVHQGSVDLGANHVLMDLNTFVGIDQSDGRINLFYADSGSSTHTFTNCAFRGNVAVDTSINTKHDDFTVEPDGARTGGWPFLYQVSSYANHNGTPNTSFLPEIQRDWTTGALSFEDAANDDYTPVDGSPLLQRLADSLVEFDILGRPRSGGLGAFDVAAGYDFNGTGQPGNVGSAGHAGIVQTGFGESVQGSEGNVQLVGHSGGIERGISVTGEQGSVTMSGHAGSILLGNGFSAEGLSGVVTSSGGQASVLSGFIGQGSDGKIAAIGHSGSLVTGGGVALAGMSGLISVHGRSAGLSLGFEDYGGTGEVNVQGHQASLSVGGGIALQGGSGTIKATGYSGVIDTAASAVLQGSAGGIAIAGHAGSVETGGGLVLQGARGLVQTSGYQGTLLLGLPHVTPAARTLTILSTNRTIAIH